jgi:hypothetical protein
MNAMARERSGQRNDVADLLTSGLLDHARFCSSQLISTCCDARDAVNFDFGNGYN